jgi:vesicular inhibitory amino acid transporter
MASPNRSLLTKIDALDAAQSFPPLLSPRVEDALAGLANAKTPRSRKYRRSPLRQERAIGGQDRTLQERGRDDGIQYVPMDDLEAISEEAPVGSSYFGASANGINLLLGVGVLSLPYALRTAGWYVGIGLLVFLTAVTNYTGKLIGRMMDKDPENIRSFGDIGKAAFGNVGQWTITIIFFLELFSACGMYLILTGDNLHTLFPHYKQFYWTLVGGVVMLPTALTSRLSFLSYFSVIGTLASSFLCLSVVYLGGVLENKNDSGGSYLDPSETRDFTSINSAPFAIGLVMVGFAGHACFPSIKLSLADPKDYNRVLNTSYCVCFSFYGLIAALGYMMYGENVKEEITFNIVKSVQGEGVSPVAVSVATVATWLVAINPCTKFGLTMNPVALIAEEAFFGQASEDDFDDSEKGACCDWRSFVVRVLLSTTCFFVAVYLPYFANVVAFVGAFCSCFVSLVFPCAAYLKMFWKNLGLFEIVLNSFLVVLGLILCVWGTLAVFVSRPSD